MRSGCLRTSSACTTTLSSNLPKRVFSATCLAIPEVVSPRSGPPMDGVEDLRGVEPFATGIYPVEDFAQSLFIRLLHDRGGDFQSVQSAGDVLDELGRVRGVWVPSQPLQGPCEVEDIGKWSHRRAFVSIDRNDLPCPQGVAEGEPGVGHSLWIDDVDETRDALLAVDDPQGVWALLGPDFERADPQVFLAGLALPEEETPEGISAKDGIEEIEDVLRIPAERTLELRQSQSACFHKGREVGDRVVVVCRRCRRFVHAFIFHQRAPPVHRVVRMEDTGAAFRPTLPFRARS